MEDFGFIKSEYTIATVANSCQPSPRRSRPKCREHRGGGGQRRGERSERKDDGYYRKIWNSKLDAGLEWLV